ncbi:MAG: aldehyde ferredoxin oxidoreductase family protein [Dehalococcoidales bacterium]|nr:aldehyde ferredoxin oxidoreductase family protein [Dehalococcoidales bacterium]
MAEKEVAAEKMENKPGPEGPTEKKAAPGMPGPAGPEKPPMGGYNGRILRVNLTDKSLKVEPLAYELARRYIGGAGFIAYYLWKELRGGIDALGPENKIIFALGPVTGLSLPGASRFCVGAKSPLTGGIAKSESGGYWMAELKRAGYDAVIFEGKSEKPVYLWIHDGEVQIRDASHLWGKATKETQESIRAELNDKRIRVAAIGPGGENLVRYACIIVDLTDAAGRGGLGAVMGSKNLKAIAVRGHNMPSIANPDYIKTLRQELISHVHPLSEYGTSGPPMLQHEVDGDLPVRNQRDGLFPGVKNITGIVMKDTIRVRMDGCWACNIRCKPVVKFEEPYVCDEEYGGPEYESLGALGSNCGIDDLKAVTKGNERCNAYSLDTISTGASIAFAMECFEKGLLTKQDTGGIDLRFGNAGAMLQAIDLISRREGIGNFIAEGTAAMARKIGQDTRDYAVNVKGLEAAMHDARAMMGFRIGYMLNPHGADHCSAMGGGTSMFGLSQFNQFGILTPADNDDFGPKRMSLYKLTHCMMMVNDCLVLCIMPNINNDQKVELVKAVTGWNTGWVELIKVGERVLTTMRLFNLREGFTAADDELPQRYYDQKTDGVLATKAIPDKATMEKARKLYYFYMGWDPDGVPTPEKTAELDIEV